MLNAFNIIMLKSHTDIYELLIAKYNRVIWLAKINIQWVEFSFFFVSGIVKTDFFLFKMLNAKINHHNYEKDF